MTDLDEILKEERLAKVIDDAVCRHFVDSRSVTACGGPVARAVIAHLRPRLEAALEAATLKIVGDDGEDL